MKKLLTIKKMALVAAISALVLSNSYGTSATIQNAGFVILLLLMAFIIYNDLISL